MNKDDYVLLILEKLKECQDIRLIALIYELLRKQL